MTEVPESSDGFVLQAHLLTPGLCQDSYCSLLGLLSASLESQPFTLCSVHQSAFGVRRSPSSHLHLALGQSVSLKAPGSPHCVQEESPVVQYSFYCPKSLQAQHLPTSVAQCCERTSSARLEECQCSYQCNFPTKCSLL